MSIPDVLMWRYFDLLSLRPTSEIDALRQQVEDGGNPRDVKYELGVEIVERFHGSGTGESAKAAFVKRFRDGGVPDDLPEQPVAVGDGRALANVLVDAGLTAGTSDSHRMIKQGAVRVDGVRIDDGRQLLEAGNTLLMQVGKRRVARVRLVVS
jgi:tyrosyl-tRNA synthetase